MNVRTLCATGLSRSNRRTFIRTATALSAATQAPRLSLAEEDTDDLLFSSAMSLSKAIRSGKVSSHEIVKACLERIESINSKINGVVTLAGERAIELECPRF